jgi:hypothetical protein
MEPVIMMRRLAFAGTGARHQRRRPGPLRAGAKSPSLPITVLLASDPSRDSRTLVSGLDRKAAAMRPAQRFRVGPGH